MDPSCFLPSHQFQGSALSADLYKPPPAFAPSKAGGRAEQPKAAEATRIITDPVTGRAYSKGRLLGKVGGGALASVAGRAARNKAAKGESLAP